jgi:hypothetical protein
MNGRCLGLLLALRVGTSLPGEQPRSMEGIIQRRSRFDAFALDGGLFLDGTNPSVASCCLTLQHQSFGGAVGEALPVGMLGLQRAVLVGRIDGVVRSLDRYIEIAAKVLIRKAVTKCCAMLFMRTVSHTGSA